MFGIQHGLDLLFERLQNLFKEGEARIIATLKEQLMADFTALNKAVSDNTAAVNAAVSALQNAGANSTDQANVNAVAATLVANNTALQNAVAAFNTPPATATPST